MDWVSPLPKDESHVTASLRYAHAAARYRDSMVVVGGFNGQPMNDALLYYPPREDCSSIPNRDKKVCSNTIVVHSDVNVAIPLDSAFIRLLIGH